MDLLTAPFEVALRHEFRGVTSRRGTVVRGPAGWGEFSPFDDYDVPRARRWWAAALEAATGTWPAPVRAAVPVSAVVPAVPAPVAASIAAAGGCRTVKVKVGDRGDVERVAAVRDALGPSGAIRVDANAAWTEDEAVERILRLARFDLEYVEQPVPTLAGMARVRRRVPVPLAADESLRTAPDPRHVPGLAEAADIIVLKAAPLGGVLASLEVAEIHGLPAVVSSALETSIGLAAGVALAAALPRLPYACGLGTAPLLAADLVRDPLVPRDGVLEVRRPDPHDDLLRAAAPAPEVARALNRRMEEVATT